MFKTPTRGRLAKKAWGVLRYSSTALLLVTLAGGPGKADSARGGRKIRRYEDTCPKLARLKAAW
eukprot:3856351-Prymnesium_polylepis.2